MSPEQRATEYAAALAAWERHQSAPRLARLRALTRQDHNVMLAARIL